MQTVYYKYGEDRPELPKLALALGFFDGVHRGHRELLRRAKERAKELSLPLGVFTFPSEAFSVKAGGGRLYSTDEKLSLLEGLGVEYVILADFDSISGLSPVDFVTRVLVSELNCALSVCGYSFRFGKGAAGECELLSSLMKAHGLESVTVEEQKYQGKTLSTSVIKTALAEGDTDSAARMLGLPYHLRGRVEHGLGLGRTLGFPTVNISLPEDSPLRSGVYHTAVPVDGKIYNALTNVGSCPTFGERTPHAETTLLDFSGDLYGKTLTVYFLSLLREEMTFASPEALTEQITKDIEKVKEQTRGISWQEIGLS